VCLPRQGASSHTLLPLGPAQMLHFRFTKQPPLLCAQAPAAPPLADTHGTHRGSGPGCALLPTRMSHGGMPSLSLCFLTCKREMSHSGQGARQAPCQGRVPPLSLPCQKPYPSLGRAWKEGDWRCGEGSGNPPIFLHKEENYKAGKSLLELLSTTSASPSLPGAWEQ
jgi:hypothetical protein